MYQAFQLLASAYQAEAKFYRLRIEIVAIIKEEQPKGLIRRNGMTFAIIKFFWGKLTVTLYNLNNERQGAAQVFQRKRIRKTQRHPLPQKDKKATRKNTNSAQTQIIVETVWSLHQGWNPKTEERDL